MYGSSATTAATSCPWNRTLSVASTAWVSEEMVGIHASLCCAISSPVTTAITPGRAPAFDVSIDRIRAWANGLRRMAMCSIPGNFTSSTYVPLPRMKRSSSFRLTEWPTPRISVASVAMSDPSSARRAGGFGGLLVLHGPPRGLDGLDDVHVTRAPAEVAGDRPPDVVLGGIGRLLQERGPGEHHARGAEAALQPVLLLERRLDRVELPVGRQPLHRCDRAPIRLDPEQGAGLHRGPVQQDRAAAA